MSVVPNHLLGTEITGATENEVSSVLLSDPTDWQTPLMLSTIAGMSTALGAAIVFALPKTSRKRSEKNGVKETTSREVSPNVMCFSLSLAGSVMVTISCISLLPEVFLSHDSITFLQYTTRTISIALGCGLYRILSRSFPVPEDIVSQEAERISNRSNNSLRVNDKKGQGIELRSSNSFDRHGSTSSSGENYTSSRRRPISPQSSTTGCDEEDCISPLLENSSFPASHSPPLNDGLETSRATAKGSTPKANGWTFRGNDLADGEQRKSWRVAMLLFVALLAHNFPEGLAVAASAAQSKSLGLTVTVGIMIHNIPEGIAIAIPCIRARPDSPWLAFILASVSGLAEPLGAAITVLFLHFMNLSSTFKELSPSSSEISQWTWTGLTLQDILAFVAGVMTMVAFCELFPEARRHIKQKQGGSPSHDSATTTSYYAGILSGFFTMVATELYLQ